MGQDTRKFVKDCNSILVGCIKHAVRSPLQLSHRAVAHALGLILPSRLEVAVKVSELFLRINSSRPDCRWGRLGRLLLRQELPSEVNSSTWFPRDRNDTRLTRALKLAVRNSDGLCTCSMIARITATRISLSLRPRPQGTCLLAPSRGTCDSRAVWRLSRSHTIDGKDGEQTRRPPQRLCMSTQMAPLKLTPTRPHGL